MTEQSKKPADTPFKQQRLPAWQPILSPPWVISCFFVVAVVFIPIGIIIIVTTGQVVEVEVQYDQPEVSRERGEKLEHWVSVRVPAEMKPPIYMYYKLDNFYQNHRRYTKSRSDKQLAGYKVGSLKDLSDCAPYRYAGEVSDENEDTKGEVSNFYAPCGLIAYSMFNDTFEVMIQPKDGPSCKDNGDHCKVICDTNDKTTERECKSDLIAWASDRKKKFKPPNDENADQMYSAVSSVESKRYYFNEGPLNGREGHKIPSQTDEEFMVWMRTASLPTFRKLHRRFPDTTLAEDDIVWFHITDKYDVASFGGHKYIILSTATWIGGKNYFLGVAYVVIGCICFVLALVFVIKHLTGSRNGLN